MASDAAARASSCRQGFLHAEVADQRYVVFFDEERRWTFVSQGVCELLQISQAEAIGKKLDSFVPDQLGVNSELFSEFLHDGYQSSVLALVRSDGKSIGVRAHARRLNDGCLVMWWEKL